MNKRYLFLFCSIIFSINVYANIPTALVLLRDTPNVDLKNITLVNRENKKEPLIASGIKLYPGDKLETNSEEVVLLIPLTSFTLTLKPFSKIETSIISLGGEEYVSKITLDYGTIIASSHQKNDLLQIVQNVSPPKDIARSDKQTDTDKNSVIKRMYVQIVNLKGQVETTNINVYSDIFITKEEVDIPTLIAALKKNPANNLDLSAYLTMPGEAPKLNIIQFFILSAYVQEFGKNEFIAGWYKIQLQKEKLLTRLRLPVLFVRDNLYYNPIGSNDMKFGAEIWDDKYSTVEYTRRVLLGTQEALLNILNKLELISYGKPQDNIYFYYGRQELWSNSSAEMFVHQYRPITSFENNFNNDIIFNLNLRRFGYDMQFRIFQNPSILDPFFTKLDLMYNRFWIRPFSPISQIELGASIAMDFALSKFSTRDPTGNVRYADDEQNKILFTGLDLKAPLFEDYRYQLYLKVESGFLVPLTKTGAISAKSFSNWGVKLGIANSFLIPSLNINNNLNFNTYFTSGFMHPHIAMSGYEYFQKINLNRLIIELQSNPSAKKFTSYFITPELSYDIDFTVLALSVGINFPISLDTAIKPHDLYLDPTFYFYFSSKVDQYLPNFLNLSLHFWYSNTLLNYDGWTILNAFERLGPAFANINFSTNLLIFHRYGIEFGFANTPKYTDDNIEFDSNSKYPTMLQIPYLTLYFKL